MFRTHIPSGNKVNATLCSVFSCPDCNQYYWDVKALAKHVRTHRKWGDELGSFLCDTCGHESNTMKQFHSHRRLHMANGMRTFECYMCRRTRTSIQSLKLHIRSHATTAENRFNCTACAASFAQKGALKRHKLGHTDIAYRGHCDICGKGCRTKADLRVSCIRLAAVVRASIC